MRVVPLNLADERSMNRKTATRVVREEDYEPTKEDYEAWRFQYEMLISVHVSKDDAKKKGPSDDVGIIIHPPDPLYDLPMGNKKGGEYISNAKVFLTYQSDIDKTAYAEWITSISNDKKVPIKEISLAREHGVTHILVMWEKVFRSRDVSIMDYQGVHPSLRYIARPHHLEKVRNYMRVLNNAYIISILAESK